VRDVLLPGPPDGVPHVGCVLRTPSAEHLEVDILLESLEQPLPAAQHERRGGDRELVYYSYMLRPTIPQPSPSVMDS
jgi:hypothetical protein